MGSMVSPGVRATGGTGTTGAGAAPGCADGVLCSRRGRGRRTACGTVSPGVGAMGGPGTKGARTTLGSRDGVLCSRHGG